MASGKKFFNTAGTVVDDALEGFVRSHAALALLPAYRVVCTVDAPDVKNHRVAVISGGGSGHEPAFVGYVGSGMLTAAVAGNVFASPSAAQVTLIL